MTHVITDASPVGLGAVLAQKQGGEFRVIMYAGRSLTDVECRYSQTEREALAIVWACERFHTYLYRTKFLLITDHKLLEVLYSKKSNPPARIERWVLRMQEFDYTVKYKPGSENIADALSRLICRDHQQGRRIENVAEEYVRFVAQTATPKEFEKYLVDNGILHCKVTPLWAQANGEVERQNRSLLKSMRIAQAEGKDWRIELVHYLATYRTTPHSVTRVCPAESLFGRRIRTKLPELCERAVNDEELRDHDWEKKTKAKIYADTSRGAQPCDLQVGDQVLLKQKKSNKLSTNFQPEPYEIVERKGNSVVIQSPQKS